MFKPNGLFFENGLHSKICHFSRLSHFRPTRLNLEKWLVFESKPLSTE
jgi:hypothetical protein